MRPEVAERTGSGMFALEPPGERRLRVDQPVLEVRGPYVPQGAEPAVGNQLPCVRDRRHLAVVEADHRHLAAGPGPFRGLGHGLRLGDRVGERLLAQHVFAGLQGGDGDLRMAVAGVQMSTSWTSSRAIRARQSVSAAAQPCRSAAAVTAVRSRPQIAARAGLIGRSKTCPAVRHPWEWAAPMNAYPTMPTPSVAAGSGDGGASASCSVSSLRAIRASSSSVVRWGRQEGQHPPGLRIS